MQDQNKDLRRRLDAYSANLGPAKKLGNRHLYAAVTSSMVAMLTGVSASAIATAAPGIDAERAAGVRSSRPVASSGGPPFLKAVRDAMAQSTAPSISPNGVVPLYGKVGTIQPGEWISIFGTNLSSGTAIWQGKFVTSLAGTSVKINGKDAFPVYVNPAQVNVQAPDDTASGPVTVTLTTAAGSTSAIVNLNSYSPSFSLLDTRHVAAIILRSDGSGRYGSGSYDILGPTGASLGYQTMAAREGDRVEIYGVGFGPTTPHVPAGQSYSGAAPISEPMVLKINGIGVPFGFVGLSSAGLYQINLTIPPGLGTGDVSIQATIGNLTTQAAAVFSLDGDNGCGCGSTGGGGSSGGMGGTGFGSWGGSSGGSGGGSGGGTGGGSLRPVPKPYQPRLRFPGRSGA